MVLTGREVPSIFPEAQRAGEGFDSDIIWSDVGYGIVPIGGIVAWCKTLVFGTSAALLIPNFLECNGQVVADGGSPFDGMALPDLNGAGAGNNRFLMGSSTSGTTGGAATHNHKWSHDTGDTPSDTYDSGGSARDMPYFGTNSMGAAAHFISVNANARDCDCYTSNNYNAPLYYEVVWVIRIK
jgi:hypothetical protein